VEKCVGDFNEFLQGTGKWGFFVVRNIGASTCDDERVSCRHYGVEQALATIE
jgi:hypothetical protein